MNDNLKKYDKSPWHDSRKELPEHGGIACWCYIPGIGETEMRFYKARKDSGYKDFFKMMLKPYHCYDYDYVKAWRKMTDDEFKQFQKDLGIC